MRLPIRWRRRKYENSTDNGRNGKTYDAQDVRGGIISGRVLTVLLISLPVAFLAMFLIWVYFAGTHAPPPVTPTG